MLDSHTYLGLKKTQTYVKKISAQNIALLEKHSINRQAFKPQARLIIEFTLTDV